jgi:uncharacterized Zn-finger protein
MSTPQIPHPRFSSTMMVRRRKTRNPHPKIFLNVGGEEERKP